MKTVLVNVSDGVAETTDNNIYIFDQESFDEGSAEDKSDAIGALLAIAIERDALGADQLGIIAETPIAASPSHPLPSPWPSSWLSPPTSQQPPTGYTLRSVSLNSTRSPLSSACQLSMPPRYSPSSSSFTSSTSSRRIHSCARPSTPPLPSAPWPHSITSLSFF